MKHNGLWLLIFISLTACKSRVNGSKTKDAEGVPCQLQAEGSPDDIIAKAAAAGCNTDPAKMFAAANCKLKGRALVAEHDNSKPRIIDAFQCGDGNEDDEPNPFNPSGFRMQNTAFFAHPDEMLTGDGGPGGLNFYKYQDGNLIHQGNSFTKGNPCLRCHVMGGMVMKELLFPWRNWLGNTFSGLTPEETARVGVDAEGKPRPPLSGPGMETMVRGASMMVALQYAKGLKTGIPELKDQTLKDVFKPIVCTVDIELHTIMNQLQDQPLPPGGINPDKMLYATLFADPNAIIRGPQQISLELPGPDRQTVKQYLSANHIEPADFVSLPVAGFTSMTRLGMLAMPPPGQDSLEPRIEVGTVFAAKLTDFPNPVFSKKRCSLLKYIPAIPMSEFSSAKDVTKKIKESMAGVNEAGPKEYLALLTKIEQAGDIGSPENSAFLMAEKMTKLIAACSKPDSAMADMTKLMRLYRSRMIPILQEKPLKYFEKISVVEHFPGSANSPSSVFPDFQAIIDGKYADDEGLALTEACQLEL
jgi:hypothetical protein